MKYKVYRSIWAGGGVDPKHILERYVAATPEIDVDNYYQVEITSYEFEAMIRSQEFDILICGLGFIAFDGKGRAFRQR